MASKRIKGGKNSPENKKDCELSPERWENGFSSWKDCEYMKSHSFARIQARAGLSCNRKPTTREGLLGGVKFISALIIFCTNSRLKVPLF